MCLRSFLVRSTDLSSWTHFLLDYRQANSSLVLQVCLPSLAERVMAVCMRLITGGGGRRTTARSRTRWPG